MPPLATPLTPSNFTLSFAGVLASVFGGEATISAMATIHLYKGRRWLGWYSSPGSYRIANRFGRMGNSRFWHGLFPGSRNPPVVVFGLDGMPGPVYTAALSDRRMRTGHLGYLTMKRSKEIEPKEIDGRKTTSTYVSYLAMKKVDYDSSVQLLPLRDALFAIIPITCSVLTCVFCAMVSDWYGFSMILLGIISNGLASYVVGEGELVLRSVRKPYGSPPGHGVMMEENEVVVIKGREEDVNAITEGHFDLVTYLQKASRWDERARGLPRGGKGVHRYHTIGCCSLLFFAQCLLQLLLISQVSLFGQIMFLFSLSASWVYNSYVSSLETEKIQTNMLFEKLGKPEILRFRTGTKATMAVFTCALLFHGVDLYQEERRRFYTQALHPYLPHDTTVWRRWSEKVVEQLLDLPDDKPESFTHLKEDDGDQSLSELDKKDLKWILDDAESAINGYYAIRHLLPEDSMAQRR